MILFLFSFGYQFICPHIDLFILFNIENYCKLIFFKPVYAKCHFR